MQVATVDHINIAAPLALLDQLRDFYCEVLGLQPGHRPAFNSKGYWLYAGTQALVHLKALAPLASGAAVTAQDSGWFGHVAFSCTDLPAWRRRLDALGVAYEIDVVAELRQVQLFLSDPAGIGVELNFADTLLR